MALEEVNHQREIEQVGIEATLAEAPRCVGCLVKVANMIGIAAPGVDQAVFHLVQRQPIESRPIEVVQ